MFNLIAYVDTGTIVVKTLDDYYNWKALGIQPIHCGKMMTDFGTKQGHRVLVFILWMNLLMLILPK